MMRLIDADDLKIKFNKGDFMRFVITKIIDMQPTIDPDVLRPQWISVEDRMQQKQHEDEVEYVNRKKLKDVFCRYKRYGADDEEERIHNAAIDQCIVALNAAPRFNRHRGHWIDSDMLFEPSECSVCKSKMYNSSGAKYCPNCGAEMEEIGEQRSDRVEEDRS